MSGCHPNFARSWTSSKHNTTYHTMASNNICNSYVRALRQASQRQINVSLLRLHKHRIKQPLTTLSSGPHRAHSPLASWPISRTYFCDYCQPSRSRKEPGWSRCVDDAEVCPAHASTKADEGCYGAIRRIRCYRGPVPRMRSRWRVFHAHRRRRRGAAEVGAGRRPGCWLRLVV